MKKAISVLLTILLPLSILLSVSVYSAEGESSGTESFIVIGDTDRDGKVTLIDSTLIQHHLISLRGLSDGHDAEEPLSDELLRITDVDEDGSMTVADAAAIQRYCLDIETFDIIGRQLPYPEPIYPTSISVNKSEIVLIEGQTYKLSDTLEPSDATATGVTWYSDNPDVAQVDSETGVIEAISRGSATVTAETVNGLTAECEVGVALNDEEDIDEYYDDALNKYDYYYYNISYNVSTMPEITTDTNNFLAATGDTSDRSGDIAAMLKKTGCCVLGSGDFFIKGVTMPDNTTIRGQGNSTRIYWINDNSPNYIFKLGSRCSLSDMWISQYRKSPDIVVQSEVRDFSAVEFSGTFNINDESPVNGPFTSTLSNLLITDIEGSGLKLSRTGTSMQAHISAVNCNILRCDCGILDDVISEFHQFTNISCINCYYGVICRGGNNTFTNCNFSGNYVGIYLDNSKGQSYNNAHGIFNACVIDHSKPDNKGTALLSDGITLGMKFSSCTFGYGKIDIKNSTGIKFYECGMGHIDVSIKDSTGTLFSNLGLRKKSDFNVTETNSENTRFINCFYRDGTEYVR